MKNNISQKVISFILKYMWIFCAVLILMEIASTVYIANILMKNTAKNFITSVSGEVSGRVDGVLRLLNGLAEDERFNDASKPLFDRGQLAKPYKDSYNLFMVAITDKELNVASTNTKSRYDRSNIADRDYLKRLYDTGTYQVTDAFIAGADGVTMNYTIAVPIIKNGVTEGSVFGSIYFNDIQTILEKNTDTDSHILYLLGTDGSVMASGNKQRPEQLSFWQRKNTTYLTTSAEELYAAWQAGTSKNFWEWGSNGLCYVVAAPIENTHWTIAYVVKFSSVLLTVLPILLVKAAFYILLCSIISIFGRKYLRKQLAEVTHLLDKITSMQKDIFCSEQVDYTKILDLSAKGLTDQLTGLVTRAVLLNKMQLLLNEAGSSYAVLFIDLDDLKRINDTFGHEVGDQAIVHFSDVLKRYEQEFQGVAARYGGDEFILVLKFTELAQVAKIATELNSAFSYKLTVADCTVPISASIGIALSPQDGNKAEELISKADFALYVAKQSGKNKNAFYEAKSNV